MKKILNANSNASMHTCKFIIIIDYVSVILCQIKKNHFIIYILLNVFPEMPRIADYIIQNFKVKTSVILNYKKITKNLLLNKFVFSSLKYLLLQLIVLDISLLYLNNF